MKIAKQKDKVIATLTQEEVNSLIEEYGEVTTELEEGYEEELCPFLNKFINTLPKV